MSHTRYCRARITALNTSVAREVLRQLVKQFGGRLVDVGIVWGTYAYYKLRATGRGVEWVYDDYAAPVKFREFEKMFMTRYNALMMMKALRGLGYQTAMREVAKGIVVTGVKMA